MDESEKIVIGSSIASLGILTMIWMFIKLISCIMIAGYLSIRIFDFNGIYWWFSSIIFFCILSKIVFYGNGSDAYSKIVERYEKSIEEE